MDLRTVMITTAILLINISLIVEGLHPSLLVGIGLHKRSAASGLHLFNHAYIILPSIGAAESNIEWSAAESNIEGSAAESNIKGSAANSNIKRSAADSSIEGFAAESSIEESVRRVPRRTHRRGNRRKLKRRLRKKTRRDAEPVSNENQIVSSVDARGNRSVPGISHRPAVKRVTWNRKGVDDQPEVVTDAINLNIEDISVSVANRDVETSPTVSPGDSRAVAQNQNHAHSGVQRPGQIPGDRRSHTCGGDRLSNERVADTKTDVQVPAVLTSG